jgi:hypothetical protein
MLHRRAEQKYSAKHHDHTDGYVGRWWRGAFKKRLWNVDLAPALHFNV